MYNIKGKTKSETHVKEISDPKNESMEIKQKKKRSRIIKDILDKEIDTSTSLKKLKVLLSEMGSEEQKNWIEHEINGYDNGDTLPKYRIAPGCVRGNFFVGYMQYRDTPIPITDIELYREWTNVPFYMGIAAIENLKEESNELVKPIPPIFYSEFMKNTTITSIHNAYVTPSIGILCEITSTVDNIVLDILLLLEKEFGNLDEYYIDVSEKNPMDLKDIKDKITNIFYDHRITIADSKISNSEIMIKSKE